MKKSEIESDARLLMQALSEDYEIPTFGRVLLVMSKVMLPVYISIAYIYVLNEVMYLRAWDYWFGVVTVYVLTCGLLSFIVMIFLYQHVMLFLCLGEDVCNKSTIIRIVRGKARFYYIAYVVINNVVGLCLLLYKEGAVVLFGLSWFVFLIIMGFCFSLSIGGYMTPAVTATLNKVGDILSSKDVEEKTL
ncbi:TPA: hypothetical protein U6I48_004819 [Klebsiella aerogenes]|nr:hypothetical protein [Klebsiella aerogenes]